jgi:hypothetical protein
VSQSRRASAWLSTCGEVVGAEAVGSGASSQDAPGKEMAASKTMRAAKRNRRGIVTAGAVPKRDRPVCRRRHSAKHSEDGVPTMDMPMFATARRHQLKTPSLRGESAAQVKFVAMMPF